MTGIDTSLIHVVHHNLGGINRAEDPNFPYKLSVSLDVARTLCGVGAMFAHGNEVLVVQGVTPEALEPVIAHYDFRNHPRLESLTLTGPEDEILEQIPAPKPAQD